MQRQWNLGKGLVELKVYNWLKDKLERGRIPYLLSFYYGVWYFVVGEYVWHENVDSCTTVETNGNMIVFVVIKTVRVIW